LALKPSGHGLTVVGDDAQSIYSFRAATVRNILDLELGFDLTLTSGSWTGISAGGAGPHDGGG
jgi:hypothetical protein